ncbi:hypothetical protein [Streptomyces uncialis]|uniref:Uncharacterized protein n=1 Tax=Streptomyces uncialis TaxID=1048205 RepID=A0A1Q4V178_9ACTN|nr:hypothetical protein [Streptomyces uncialis]MCX4659933.1 hypothetical protein [Streptomyces uncialis]OKH91556.1 hypothetical protein AB852_28820 [Streptomyces uncialis]WTE13355.1 hypothetical protein OG924_25875 [Streptomyces uncialis]
MFEFEIHQLHAADLHREAAHHRLVRAVRKARKADRARLAQYEAEGQVSAGEPGPERFTRAA